MWLMVCNAQNIYSLALCRKNCWPLIYISLFNGGITVIIWMYSRLSLLTPITSGVIVSANTALANTAPLLLGRTGLGSYKPLVTIFLPAYRHVTLFWLCFCFKTCYSIDIAGSLASNSWTMHRTWWSLSDTPPSCAEEYWALQHYAWCCFKQGNHGTKMEKIWY